MKGNRDCSERSGHDSPLKEDIDQVYEPDGSVAPAPKGRDSECRGTAIARRGAGMIAR
jgi:hypothetical protein